MKLHRDQVYLFLLFAISLPPCSTVAAAGNSPPQVVMTWPTESRIYADGTLFKIKAEASDTDGLIAQVSFYANSELIGTATNPPYNMLWLVGNPGGLRADLKAVATDDRGATNETAPVTIVVSGTRPTVPFVQINAPLDGMMLPANIPFEFTAEVLASTGDAGPIEFLVNDIPVGQAEGERFLSANTPPSSITISNLAAGDRLLQVRYLGNSACTCYQSQNSIRVVQLGIHSPRHTLDGLAEFEVVTSFPSRPNIIEISPNLHDWTPISTNVPSTNAFTFTAPSPIGDSNLFYRVRVPPE